MTEIQTLRAGSADAEGAAPGPARRRYLTILFSDLVGSTPLSGALPVEEYYSLAFRPLRDAWHELIPAFGGRVNEIRGDGAVAVFGWPEGNESDGQMATLAALALHERMRALDGNQSGAPRLRLHSGIHSGLVLASEIDGRLELLGSAMNVAARLADAAEPDEIIVSEATLGPDRGAFVTSERLHLKLKGKEKPIAAFRVLDRAPENTRYAARERGGLSPFVGRKAELEKLAEVVDRVAAGGTSFVSVVGPPGVGKTRLVSELLARAGDSLQVYRGECDAHLGAEPLQPFLQMLRSALGVDRAGPSGRAAESIHEALAALGADLSEHGDVLLRLLAPAESGRRKPPPDLASVAAALRALFVLLAEGGPLALFIDDWQSADDASRRLLQELRDMAWSGLLVLLTMRGEAVSEPFDDFERLDLTPFNDDEAEAAIRQVLPAADPFLIGDICAAAGGNPLFLEELCHSVAYGEQDFRTHGGSGWLDILIESRFARLPDAQADLLATAAVIGNVIPVWLLKLTTGHGAEDPLVRGLAEEDFIFPGEREGTLRFKHGIAREVIYDSVGLRERRALHLRIAEALQHKGAAEGEEEHYEALAYHYGAGGSAAEAAHYAECAGNKALAAASLDQAQRQYRAALDALDRLPPSPEIEKRWSKVARRIAHAGVWDPSADQLPVLERAVDRAAARADDRDLALAEHWLAYIHYGLGNAAEAIAHSRRAFEMALALGEGGLEIHTRALLGQSLWEATEHAPALALLDEAIAAMRQDEERDPTWVTGFAYALACKAWILADLGRFAEAIELFEESLREVRGSDQPVQASILSIYFVVRLWEGSIEEAARIAAEMMRVSSRVRTFYMYAKGSAHQGYTRWLLSGGAEGADQLAQATAWLDQHGRDQYLSLNYAWLAETLAAEGKGRAALRHAARAMCRARKGDRLGEAAALRAVARLAAAEQNWTKAEHYLERAAVAARARTSPHELATTQLCAAEIALARGDRDRSLALLAEADAAFAEMSMEWHAGQAARLRERAAA